MSYTKSCFIRKNTEELRNKLIKLGYDYGGKSSSHGSDDCLYSGKDVGRFFECSQKPARYDIIIDCGDNEELFLALAALRDDTAKKQWFICDKVKKSAGGRLDRVGQWFIWDIGIEPTEGDMLGKYYHKATIEEIIEHFKKD